MARKYGFLILSGCFLISFMIPDEVYTQEKSYFGHEEFPQDIYAARRQRFMDQMDDGLAVIPGKVRNTYGQVDERPARYFYYLTGIEEPGAWCILDPSSSETYKLFVRPYRLMNLIWSGKETGVEVAEAVYGADKAFSSNDLDRVMGQLIRDKKKVYLNMNDRWMMEKMIHWTSRSHEMELINARPILDEMRVIKDDYEQAQLKSAAEITADAVIEAIKFTQPGVWEYEVEAVVEYMFRSAGASGPGFSSIVGSGIMSTVLHYETNQRRIIDGDMMVMDVGALVNRYTADVTRTIPVNGRFTQAQKEIYTLVLTAQKKAIDLMLPGHGLEKAHLKASEIIIDGLFKLGLVTDPGKEWQKKLYILYENSHYIGLYVHDVGDYGREVKEGRTLLPGMVLTIEPGIYIHPLMLETLHDRLGKKVPPEEVNEFIEAIRPAFEQYRGIGIRIEDDILITTEGQENISGKVPKEIGEIESLMKKRSIFNRL